MRITFSRKLTFVALSIFISTAATVLSQAPAAPVELNSATKQQLMALEGVTPEIAERIASGRPYKAVQDLVVRKIIDPAIYEKIKTKVKVVPSKTVPKQAPIKAPFGTAPGEK